jgi:hypothetical protein
VGAATGESLVDQVELDPTVVFPLYELESEGRPIGGRVECPCQFLQHVLSELPIDRTPIIRIDQVEVPELAALVEVGNTRSRDLDEGLSQRAERAVVRNAGLKRAEILEETG